MEKSGIRLSYNKRSCSYEIEHKGFSWVSDGRKPFIIIRKKVGKKYISTMRRLCSATKKTVTQSENEVICTYSGFIAFGRRLGFTLVCKAEVTGEDSVEFSLRAENETGFDIQAVYFPAPFNSRNPGENSYHVDAMRQGFILPDGYKENFASTFAYTKYPRKINTGDCYMPVWGRVCDGHTFTAIVETPFDVCMYSSFGKHKAFVNSTYWCSSLGKLSYERKIRFIFHEEGDYNTVAKDYRAYLKEKGEFLSLEEKIEKNPNIRKLLGTPVLHHKIYSKINEKSSFYDKKGSNEILTSTFSKRAQQLRKLREMGLERLYIHTDGWGKNGYDNDHPYILPPCEKAGGWEGFRELANTSRELGYIFALHDQYRDYYYDSPVYDSEKAVTNIDSTHPYCSIWDGGEHTFLCSTQALDFVKRTYTELEEHGIDVQGAYLDVFGIMWGDECFHKDHPVTREESIRHRAACFDYLNEKGFIMSSEEPGMQLLNHVALVHHGPFSLRPQENGQAVGIPVPLGNLVFHDCVVVPWNWFNNWGIPKGDDGDLYGALCAGIPYIHPFEGSLVNIGTDKRTDDGELLSDEKLKAELERIRPLCELQARLWNKEMVSHKFMGDYRKQQAVYSDGTTIIIDLDKGTYEIQYPEK